MPADDRRLRTSRSRRLLHEWRPSAITLGAPVLPLGVLFGLNAVDELDRTAFAVLLPDFRDYFELTNVGALGLVAATTISVVLIEVPLAFSKGNADDRLARLVSSRPYVNARATTLLLLVMWNSGREVFESDG